MDNASAYGAEDWRFESFRGRKFLPFLLCWKTILEIIQEKTHNQICEGITHFTPERLRRTSTDEKQVLPTPQGKKNKKSGNNEEANRFSDIKQEKQHQELTHNIEGFDSGKLNPVSTEEKMVLPSKEGLWNE